MSLDLFSPRDHIFDLRRLDLAEFDKLAGSRIESEVAEATRRGQCVPLKPYHPLV